MTSAVARTRTCSRAACGAAAVATLTYVYADQTAVLGPLATFAEPHTYDLCSTHATRLTAPRGWDVVKLAVDLSEPSPSEDDLSALADAVRAAGTAERQPTPAPAARPDPAAQEAATEELLAGSGRRRHLRLLPED
ncbi:DUF3499 domain-containing protein [Demetria terragena]|uniref:DUF3499 domain-containing protein n=1 Tax=Demetria terragena TaxID=63959 RepID=UPI00035F1615|nr:DUF3499 domain-containing protein [Demetria terragena]